MRNKRRAKYSWALMNPIVQAFSTACSLTADETALILARFYMSPPANPGWTGF
jgi:hypothetical protein